MNNLQRLSLIMAGKLPELKSRLADDGMTVVASTPEQFAEFLVRETAGIKGSP